MKHIYLIFLLFLIISSCIPVKIAPQIEDYKITTAKKFKRKLPKQASFIFNDPKDSGEFYDYVNNKYDLNDKDVGYNVPFEIDKKTYYLTYVETERQTKTINLPLVIADAKRESNGNTKLFEDSYTNRTGKWYIILTVFDDDLNNCLKDDYVNKEKVTSYLKSIKDEYLTTYNYQKLLFKKKS